VTPSHSLHRAAVECANRETRVGDIHG
jgi:hypothetical protein